MRFLLSLIILTTTLVAPSATLALTLEEAIAQTMTNHQRLVQVQADSDEVSAGVGQARSSYYPSIDIDYLYTNRNDPPVRDEEEVSVLSFNASYNLFNGLTDLNNIKAAKARAAAAEYQLRAVRADLVLATRQAYIAQLQAMNTVETNREGVILLQRQHRDNQLFFQQGLIARNDLLRVEVELSAARQDLLLADGILKNNRRRLERLIGITLAEDEKLEDFQDLPQYVPSGTEPLREQLLEQRSELRYLESLLEAAGYDYAAIRGEKMPRLDLVLAHEEYGDSLSPGGAETDSDDKLLLSATWNLFNGFSTSQSLAAADSRKRSLAAQLQDTRDELLLQLQTAVNDINIARGLHQEALIGVAQAEENYRVTESLNRQQQTSTFDLLDARFLLTQARNREVITRYALHDRAAVLDRVLERGVGEQGLLR